MSNAAIIEKDRLQKERDAYRSVLEAATQIDGRTWRAEQEGGGRWRFARKGWSAKVGRYGRRKRYWVDVEKGISTSVLLDRITEAEGVK